VLRCERLPRGAGYTIHVSQPLRIAALGTDAAALAEGAKVINETMEQTILNDPGQYLWGYNRYKPPRTAQAPAARAEGSE
jgi:KDO2-lipid IV(A) lauroyltransferase